MFEELGETLSLINELRKESENDDEVFEKIVNYKLDRNDTFNLHRYIIAQALFRDTGTRRWLFRGGNLSVYNCI